MQFRINYRPLAKGVKHVHVTVEAATLEEAWQVAQREAPQGFTVYIVHDEASGQALIDGVDGVTKGRIVKPQPLPRFPHNEVCPKCGCHDGRCLSFVAPQMPADSRRQLSCGNCGHKEMLPEAYKPHATNTNYQMWRSN